MRADERCSTEVLRMIIVLLLSPCTQCKARTGLRWTRTATHPRQYLLRQGQGGAIHGCTTASKSGHKAARIRPKAYRREDWQHALIIRTLPANVARRRGLWSSQRRRQPEAPAWFPWSLDTPRSSMLEMSPRFEYIKKSPSEGRGVRAVRGQQLAPTPTGQPAELTDRTAKRQLPSLPSSS